MNALTRREIFFENVCCYDKETEQQILKWVSDLFRVRKISIEKFSYLFSKYEKVIFPIKISIENDVLYNFVDNNGNKGFFQCVPYKNDYSIGLSQYPYYSTFEFNISKEKITKTEGKVFWINEDGIVNNDYVFKMSYEDPKNSTTLTFNCEDYQIKIVYPVQDEKFDEKVMEYLFCNYNSVECFYDIFKLFIFIENIKTFDSLTIKASCLDDSTSEIVMVNRTITKYSFTEIISDLELCRHQYCMLKKANEFISEYLV